jgi:hypothetical protein
MGREPRRRRFNRIHNDNALKTLEHNLYRLNRKLNAAAILENADATVDV